MLGQSTQHVASRGAVQCGWRQCAVTVDACRSCPFFQAHRAVAATPFSVDVVTCTEPVPLA